MLRKYFFVLNFLVLLTFSESIVPHPAKHEISYKEEYNVFETELITSIPEVKSRSKRFIYLNPDTYVAVAFLLGVPVSLVLPSLSNLFNKWRRRRSVDDGDDSPYFPEADSIVQPELDKISTYFQLVDIPEHSCQLRAVCEFSANPEKFYPLSEMILSRIRNPNLPPMIYLENQQKTTLLDNSTTSTNGTSPSLFRIYNEAANNGLEYGNNKCESEFGSKCQYSMDKLLNMPTMRFWTAMQRFLKLKFTDGNLSF